MNIPVLACKVPGEGFQMWSHEVFTSHAVELNQEKFEQLTALSEFRKEEVSDPIVERPQLTSSARKKGLQIGNDQVHYVFEINHLMDKCLKFKHAIETVITPYKEMYKDMQKKAEHLKMTPFFIKSSVSPSAMHSMPSDHHDNFQPGILSSFQ